MDKIIIELTGNSAQLDATIDKLAKLGKTDKANEEQFKKSTKAANDALDGLNKKADATSNLMNKIGNAIAGAFVVDKLIGFGKAIIDTRAEFQKFEAQLVTALGSQSAAQAALSRIQSFAASTPYSVQEITDAFVRMANRGIQPTNDQLRKMGDVAAALGKPLAQVNEAILDINNTERWKELGIKVETHGDKIIGTFKGMRLEAAKTEAGALSLITRFGEMKGVAGGMEAQSKTLGGQLSNLGDSFDRLKNNIGKSGEGGVAFALSGLTNILNNLSVSMENTYKAGNKLGQSQWQKGFEQYMTYITGGLGKGASSSATLGETQTRSEAAISTLNDAISMIDKNDKLAKEKADKYVERTLQFLQLESQKARQAKATAGDIAKLLSDEDVRGMKLKYINQTQLEAIKIGKDFQDVLAGINDKTKTGNELTEKELEKQRELLEGWRKRLRDLKIENIQDEQSEEQTRITEEYQREMKRINQEVKNEELRNKLLKELHIKWVNDMIAIDDKYLKKQKEEEERLKNLYEKQKKYADDKFKDLETDLDKELALQQKRNKEEAEAYEKQKAIDDKKKKDKEELAKKMIATTHEILQASLDAIEKEIEAEISANELRIHNEDKIIETQKILAQKGYENTLAFEQKRRDDLVKQQLAEKEKLRKIKEFEILLNAVAKFAEENPRTALAKALGLLASTKAAETLFAEEGGVVGSGMQTARGRRHKSGRDRLVLAEEGEGIIPVAVMKKMGFSTKDKFNKFLKTPFKDLPALINNNVVDFTGVINEVKELKQVMMNKKELAVDWNGLDMRITELENGLRTVTTHKRHYL